MSIKKINFQKTVMYKIVCNDLNVKYIYVGHTTKFAIRKTQHKSHTTNVNGKAYNYKVYQTIRENGGWENWTMLQIEEYPCNNLNEATLRERYLYELLNANLNMISPNTTREQYLEKKKIYREENNEKIKQLRDANKAKKAIQDKEYREANKEKVAERKKAWYEANKAKLAPKYKEYAEANKEKIKMYQQEYHNGNKLQIKAQQKEYYLANKEKRKEKDSKAYKCECGIDHRKVNKSQHCKSTKHIEAMRKKCEELANDYQNLSTNIHNNLTKGFDLINNLK